MPFADLFNHKSSIVSLSPEYALEGACLAQNSESESEQESQHTEEGALLDPHTSCLPNTTLIYK